MAKLATSSSSPSSSRARIDQEARDAIKSSGYSQSELDQALERRLKVAEINKEKLQNYKSQVLADKSSYRSSGSRYEWCLR